MSDENESALKLDEELNSSPSKVVDDKFESLDQFETVLPTSPSHIKTNPNKEDENNNNPVGSNDLEAIPTVLVGCSLCLMYFMIPKNDFKCPKCNNTIVLLDFLSDENENDNDNNDNDGDNNGNDDDNSIIKKNQEY